MILSVCPTGCDDDCDTLCHEAHAVTWKRDHDVTLCEVRAHLLTLLAEANRECDERRVEACRAFAPSGAMMALQEARSRRVGIARCIEELENVQG